MNTRDFDAIDNGEEVVKATEHLKDMTQNLADFNAEPHLHQDEVEGFFAAIIRIVLDVFKH